MLDSLLPSLCHDLPLPCVFVSSSGNDSSSSRSAVDGKQRKCVTTSLIESAMVRNMNSVVGKDTVFAIDSPFQ